MAEEREQEKSRRSREGYGQQVFNQGISGQHDQKTEGIKRNRRKPGDPERQKRSLVEESDEFFHQPGVLHVLQRLGLFEETEDVIVDEFRCQSPE